MRHSLPPNDIYRYYDKISVRVLPHTDMNDIDLPVEVDNFDSVDDGLSKKDHHCHSGAYVQTLPYCQFFLFMQQAIPTKSDW